MSQLTQRFQNIFQLQDHYFEIIGCGAIGSFTAMNLARAGATNFSLWDPDTVDPVNIGVQHYDLTHIGNSKVKMLSKQMSAINPNVDITTHRQKFNNHTATGYYHRGTSTSSDYRRRKTFFIIGIDNMAGRKQIVEDLICRCSSGRYWTRDQYMYNQTYVIDARMGSETFQMYYWELIDKRAAINIARKKLAVEEIEQERREYSYDSDSYGNCNDRITSLKSEVEDIENAAINSFQDSYLQEWYSDENGDSEPCNARSTNYCASMAGAFINNQIRKLVDSSSPSNPNLVFNFPSMALKCDTNYNLRK